MKRLMLLCLLCLLMGCQTTDIEEEDGYAPLPTKAPRDPNRPRYELFQGRERISGDTTDWTRAEAIEHLRWYRSKSEKNATARGYFNGEELIVPDLEEVPVFDPNHEGMSVCDCSAKIERLEAEIKELKALLALPEDIESPSRGRFRLQVSHTENNAFVIDTHTGQVWQRFPKEDFDDDTFYQPKIDLTKNSDAVENTNNVVKPD